MVKRHLMRLVCRVLGHIPVHDGHTEHEIVHNFKAHDWEKLSCLRCSKALHLIDEMFLLEKVQRWELSVNTKRDLKIHDWLEDHPFWEDHELRSRWAREEIKFACRITVMQNRL